MNTKTSRTLHTRLKATQDILRDHNMMRQIDESRTFFRNGQKGLSFEDVFGEPFTLPRKKTY